MPTAFAEIAALLDQVVQKAEAAIASLAQASEFAGECRSQIAAVTSGTTQEADAEAVVGSFEAVQHGAVERIGEIRKALESVERIRASFETKAAPSPPSAQPLTKSPAPPHVTVGEFDDERNDWRAEDGSAPGAGGYWYPAKVADYVDELPARKDLKTGNFPNGRKTTGYLVGKSVAITSGTGIGYPEAKKQLEEAGFEPRNANFLAMHVEMKLVLAVLRRANPPEQIEIVINNRPCRKNENRPGCGVALRRLLDGVGMSVIVYGTDEQGKPFKRTYPAKESR